MCIILRNTADGWRIMCQCPSKEAAEEIVAALKRYHLGGQEYQIIEEE